MDKDKDTAPMRSSQVRNIEVVDDADWLKDSERFLMYEEELEDYLLVVVPKDYNL